MKKLITVLSLITTLIIFTSCQGETLAPKVPGNPDGNETASSPAKPDAPVIKEIENLKTEKEKLQEEIASLEKEIEEIDQTLEAAGETLATSPEKSEAKN